MAVFQALSGEISLDKRDYTRGLRDAAKSTTRFGKTATGTFDEVGDEAAEAGTEAAASSGGFRRLADAMGDAVLPARMVSLAADEAGDEIREAGRSALGAASGFAALQVSSTGLSMSLGLVSTVGSSTLVILGALGVAAAVLVTALLPIVAGALGVAAAFGAILSTGIIAGMDELKKTFNSVKKEITPLIKEFGARFVPFLKETIRMLPSLVSSLLDAIGPTDQFFAALRDLRNAAFDLLPKMVKWFIDLGRWALPILRKIGKFIVNSVAPAFRDLIGTGKGLNKDLGKLKKTTVEFWREGLKPFLAALGPLTGELLELGAILLLVSMKILTKLLPALIPLIKETTKIVRMTNDFIKALGGVQSASENLSPRMKTLVQDTRRLWRTLKPLIFTLMDIGRRVLPFVIDGMIMTMKTFNDLGQLFLAVVTNDFGKARKIFFRIHRRIFSFFKRWGSRLVRWLKSNIVQPAVDWFGRLGKRAMNQVQTWFGDLVSWLKHDAKSDIQTAAWAIGQGMAHAFKRAFNSAMPNAVPIPEITLGEGVPGPDYTIGGGSLSLPKLHTGGRILSSGAAILKRGEEVLSPAQVDRRERGGGPQSLDVHVTFDTKDEALQQWVDERAEVTITDQLEQTRRKAKRRGTR